MILVCGGLGLTVIGAIMVPLAIARAYRTPDGARAMLPTLMPGDHFYTDHLIYRLIEPARGDVVVLAHPKDQGRAFTLRAIGLAGETIEIDDDRVYIDGARLTEPYALFEPTVGVPPRLRSFPLTPIPAGKLFVLGDNRYFSEDSRFWGLVDRGNVKAKVFIIYWSWDAERGRARWGRIGRVVR
jgi:signal peptidase I